MSLNFWETLRYDSAEKEHTPAEWPGLIHQDDLQTALENFHKHCENPAHPEELIVRYCLPSGRRVGVPEEGAVSEAPGSGSL